MVLTIAGVKKEVKDGITIEELIEIENVESPLYVSVSVNDEFAQREDFAVKKLSDGDIIEFLYFMGGGCC
ncbi:MAG: sulfur carrier protein ThiS [Mobilitalea sp.]